MRAILRALLISAALLVPCVADAESDGGAEAGSTEAGSLPPACLAMKAKFAELEAADETRKQARANLEECDAWIVQYRADLAREKANPSGVVDLRRLHDIGERIQSATEARPGHAAALAAWTSEVKRLLGDGTKLIAACKAAKAKS